MLPRRYATNREVIAYFALLGIEVTNVRIKGKFRHLECKGVPIQLPMDASPGECIRLVKEGAGIVDEDTTK